MMWCRWKRQAKMGLTLVELLVSLALLGLISLSISNFVIKGNVTSASIGMRFTEVAEIQMLFSDIRDDFKRGVSISDNSYNQRLEYMTYDAQGNAVRKIYRITTVSGRQVLQLSRDGGATWGSPYRISSYDRYILKGTPLFLYAASTNNCTNFQDSAAPAGVRTSADSAGGVVACAEGGVGTALSLPSQASKVDFQSFSFSTGTGSPEAIRSLPTDIYFMSSGALVRNTDSPASPAVRDSSLQNSFVTNTANSMFGTQFAVSSVAWDPARDTLIVVGGQSSGNQILYRTDRRGIMMGKYDTGTTTITANSVAVQADGQSVFLLSGTNLYSMNLSTPGSVTPGSPLSLSGKMDVPKGVAYDAYTPNDVYLVGGASATGPWQIQERNASTGALVGSAWSLPSAFNSSAAPPSGIDIEPVNGDFIVVRNSVNANGTIDIYLIDRTNTNGASNTRLSFSVNLGDLPNSATTTGTNGNWGVAYDPVRNRIFLTDSNAKTVYQIVPPVLLSPRT